MHCLSFLRHRSAFTKYSRPSTLRPVDRDDVQLHCPALSREEANEPFDREARAPAVAQVGESRWIDLEQLCRGEEVQSFSHAEDFVDQLALQAGNGIVGHADMIRR